MAKIRELFEIGIHSWRKSH